MKMKLILKLVLMSLLSLISLKSFAAYHVSYTTRDGTSIAFGNGKYDSSCTRNNDCFRVFGTGQRSPAIQIMGPNNQRFKFFLSDTGNWALHAYYGNPDVDKNDYIRLDEGQIQLHSSTIIDLYSDAQGVRIVDEDGKVFQLVDWND